MSPTGRRFVDLLFRRSQCAADAAGARRDDPAAVHGPHRSTRPAAAFWYELHDGERTPLYRREAAQPARLDRRGPHRKSRTAVGAVDSGRTAGDVHAAGSLQLRNAQAVGPSIGWSGVRKTSEKPVTHRAREIRARRGGRRRSSLATRSRRRPYLTPSRTTGAPRSSTSAPSTTWATSLGPSTAWTMATNRRA